MRWARSLTFAAAACSMGLSCSGSRSADGHRDLSTAQTPTARERTEPRGAGADATTVPAPTARAETHGDCDPSAANSDGTPKRARPGRPNIPGHALVLAYDDFGPQASAHTLLGMDWWAWEGGGSFERCDAFDVRVVVYRGISRSEVQADFPTAKSAGDLERGLADVRYVEYQAALEHLDLEIRELSNLEEGDTVLAELRALLERTRARIVAELGA
ncbi:MAG: hypothetical protein U0271_44480 [Polyangiaceae bacterium]